MLHKAAAQKTIDVVEFKATTLLRQICGTLIGFAGNKAKQVLAESDTFFAPIANAYFNHQFSKAHNTQTHTAFAFLLVFIFFEVVVGEVYGVIEESDSDMHDVF